MMRSLLLPLLMTLASPLQAEQRCSTEIRSSDQMTYDKSEIRAPRSCASFTLTLVHPGTLPREVMGHNWVLSRAGDLQSIAADGSRGGPEHDYLEPGDSRVLATTRLIAGGERDSVTFETARLIAHQDYRLFCSVPFHATLMQGRLLITE